MILALAFGFGLGVLATVLAGVRERKQRWRVEYSPFFRGPIYVRTDAFADGSPRRRQERAAAYLDSTLPKAHK